MRCVGYEKNLFVFDRLNLLSSIPLAAQQRPDSVLAKTTAAKPGDSLDAEAVLRGETQLARDQWLRRRLFVDHILMRSSANLKDSSLFFRLQQQTPLSLKQSQLNGIPPRLVPIEESIRRDQREAPSLFNVGSLLGKGVKYLAEKLGAGGAKPQPLAVIPSELEMDVMTVLWQKQKATTAEIYTHLDSARLTAVDLQQTLDIMAERGLLDRQQISPRHEFTILGTIPIEMSAKNRKNREYLYRPQVTRQTMLAFLDATAFSQRLASPGNHSSMTASRYEPVPSPPSWKVVALIGGSGNVAGAPA
jgi:predicted transcriptional regulator